MVTFTLPFGFNRADGTTGLPSQTNGLVSGQAGTPSSAGAITPSGNAATVNNAVEEDFDSPEIERAEQGTAQHRFKMLWNTAINYITVLGRGTFITDGFGNRWRILSSKIQSLKGGMASLSVTSESLSFDSPPDEYQCVPVELNVDIMKHPRYNWALLPWAYDQSTFLTITLTDSAGAHPTAVKLTINDVKQSIIRMIQIYRDTPYLASADNINSYVKNNIVRQLDGSNVNNPQYFITTSFVVPTAFFDASKAVSDPSKVSNKVTGSDSAYQMPTGNFRIATIDIDVTSVTADKAPSHPIAIAKAAAYEILSKIWRGEDTPPVTAYEMTLSQYYFAPTYLNPGNYVENPIGIVPDYFTDPTQTGKHTIFDEVTLINPQCFATSGISGTAYQFSCLRKPDEVDYQRTWFKVTRKWLCSPVGHWDQDLNTQENRPQLATDYHGVI